MATTNPTRAADPLYLGLDATAQADAVRAGEISPLELIEAAIGRIRRVDPVVGALVSTRFEEARAEAGRIPSTLRFSGVPTLVKDCLSAIQAGLPYFGGNRLLRERPFVATADSPMGAGLREAGFITLGTTKIPELQWMTTTQPLAFGPTRNPWSLDHSVGGSSGGSAAAVASGMVPVANAVENGGSIRIPASFCGVVGLKPTRARVPLPEPQIDPLLHTFMVTRSVRDCAALLDVLGTGAERGLFASGRGLHRVGKSPSRPEGLRVGIALNMGGVEAHPDCVTAVEETTRVLQQLGCKVEQSVPPALTQLPSEDAALLARCQALLAVRDLEALIGRPVERNDVEPFTWWAAKPDEAAPPADAYALALTRRRAWAVDVMSWWDEHDFLLTPTVSDPPTPLAVREAETPAETALTEERLMAFTAPFDETGQPAVTLPLHWNAQGLPIGVQLVADVGRDELLLDLSARLEEAMPWKDRSPALN